MTDGQEKQLGKVLWSIANMLRGAMNADDFRDYMLSFIFLKYISDNYEAIAKENLETDYPEATEKRTSLQIFYKINESKIRKFEQMMRARIHCVIKPDYLWSNIARLALHQDNKLLKTLKKGFKYIEEESFEHAFKGLFSEIHLDSDKLGKDYTERNGKIAEIITEIDTEMANFSTDTDILGDAYEYLIGKFAAGGGAKAGEYYTPQQVSSILSQIIILDSQNPSLEKKKELGNILDFACGSGSLLLNVRKQLDGQKIGMIHGQEKNITTYNLARMNMLLHGVKDSDFNIYRGDTLLNDSPDFNTEDPSKTLKFEAVVANPPFSLKWEKENKFKEDPRFKNYGLAPKSYADFAFLLHGFHHLDQQGTMAIILPHGVLFRGRVEEKIRRKLIEEKNIDAIIGLPANLFFSTDIPVCIIILKKCKKENDILIIDASKEFQHGKNQHNLLKIHVDKIVDTYKNRKEIEKYSRRVSMKEIEENKFNMNISLYIDNFQEEEKLSLKEIGAEILELEDKWKGLASITKKDLKKVNKEVGKGGGIVEVKLSSMIEEIVERKKDKDIELVLSVTNDQGLIPAKERFKRKVASEDLSNYKIVKKGQYAYSPPRINVGSIARLDNWDIGLISPIYVCFKLDEEQLCSDYFLHWLRTHKTRQKIKNSTQGSVRQSLGFDVFSSMTIPLPPLEKQKEIAGVLNSASWGIATLEELTEKYQLQKKALMQQILSGE